VPTLLSHPGAANRLAVSPGRLLAPARRTVPFVGRTAEKSALVSWCDTSEPVSVRLVSGTRGVGKSRLAREVAHAVAQAGWTCLDVPDGAEPAALAAIPDGAPALLVLDDADTRGPALADLLRAAARGRNGTLRILLVARDVGPWFDRLTSTDLAVRALLEPARVSEALTTEVLPGQVDARLVAAFVELYAQALGVAVPHVAVASLPGGARMLDLQAAALCAVLRAQAAPPEGVLPVDLHDTLDELLGHERWVWFRLAERAGLLGEAGFQADAMDTLVAAATLTGVRTPDAAGNLVRRVSAVVPGVCPGAEDAVGRWLVELDPHRTLPARLVDPHLLAELTGTPELLGACLREANAPSARRAALRMTRIVAERLEEDSADQGPALDQLGAALAALPDEHDALRSVSGLLPYPSLALGEVRTEIALRTLAVVPDDAALRAEALRDAGSALTEVGRAADAERYQRAAVTLLRGLAEEDPHRFRPRLAAVLANLGATCSDQGRPRDALRCEEEAVSLLRLVAEAHPGVVTLDLTMAVSNLAVTFAELGKPLAALGPSREAARLWRELAGENPGRFTWALALSLMNVARRLLELDRAEEALVPATESLDLRRRLAAADPDEHLSALGDSLQVMGTVAAARGRAEQALPYLEEAVAVRRRTAEENPGRYLSDLAHSLRALGTQLSDAGRRAEGCALQQEAVEVLRRLVAENPGRFAPELAEALSALGVTLSRLDLPQDALNAEREATRTWRGLVGSDPHRHRPGLARSLTNVSSIFAVLRLGDEAVAPAGEAVSLLRELAAENPARYRPRLAEALRALALALHDQERFGEAQRARAEAEELGGMLARQSRRRPRIANSLSEKN